VAKTSLKKIVLMFVCSLYVDRGVLHVAATPKRPAGLPRTSHSSGRQRWLVGAGFCLSVLYQLQWSSGIAARRKSVPWLFYSNISNKVFENDDRWEQSLQVGYLKMLYRLK
jgi:hypothetical protein